jgi:streptogramin lyase
MVIMRLSYSTGPFLILAVLSVFSVAPGRPTDIVDPTFVLQTSPQQYVTLLQKVPSSSPSPYLIYPTSSTIWVAGIAFGPPRSQIREFFIDGTSKGVLNLTNVIVSSILADPTDPSTRVWFTENSTLAFYDSVRGNETRAITFPGQDLQFLTTDPQGRIWMSMVGSSGDSTIAVYDPSSHLHQNYVVPTKGAIIQGITVNAAGNTIWFAEGGLKRIGRLVPGGSQPFSEFSPPLSISLAFPIQVAVDASGDVWFTDHSSDQFGVFDPLTGAWKVFPIGYCPDNCVYGLPNAIFIDAKNTVWFSEHIAGRVGRYDPSTGVLTEYAVPGSSTPLMWWAMPGPNNLVWFVAWALGEIGYVNASLPAPFSISGPSGDVVVQRGNSISVPARVSSQGTATLSFGVSPMTQDQPVQFPAQVYGSSPSNLTLNNGSQTATFSVSAAWNATLAPRYMALTASDGQVAVSIHVRVVVAEASAPFVALGFSSVIVLGGLTLYLRRPKKPKSQPVKKTRR